MQRRAEHRYRVPRHEGQELMDKVIDYTSSKSPNKQLFISGRTSGGTALGLDHVPAEWSGRAEPWWEGRLSVHCPGQDGDDGEVVAM